MRFTSFLFVRRSIMDDIGELTKKYANLPERYIKRVSNPVEYKTPNRIEYLPHEQRIIKRWRFGMNRPWTEEFQREHKGFVPHTHVEPIKDWLIFCGDRVEVLMGRDKGKQGIVTQVIQERNWVIVGGLNWELKEVGQGGGKKAMVVRDERPLRVTDQVCLVDPSDQKIAKVEWRYTEDGERVRVSLRTGRIIPILAMADETHDYKSKSTYVENELKDTKAAKVQAATFEPKLKTFEMEIMENMGIVETRVPKKSYWY